MGAFDYRDAAIFQPQQMSDLLTPDVLKMFMDPAANKEKIRELGKGLTGSEQPASMPTRDLDVPMLSGDLPTRDVDVPLLSADLPAATDRNDTLQVQSAPQGGGEDVEKTGIPWVDLARLANVGLTDLGNALGNPRARMGGGLYEMNRDYFQTSQMEQLRKRHEMFDDAFKQSQALPSEVLVDERFSGLSAAKAALEKDAADGKIDNEKNVSTFLTEMARSKKDLEQLQLQTQVQNELAQEEKMETARRDRASAVRTQFENIVANPTQYSPDQVRAAQLQLQALKAQDFETMDMGGKPLTLSGSQWAEFEMRKAADERDLEQRNAELSSREKMHRESLASDERNRAQAEKTRQSMFEHRAGRDAARTTTSAVAAGYRRALDTLKRNQQEGKSVDPKAEQEAYASELLNNGDAIMNAAQQSGVSVRKLDNLGMGNSEDETYEINGDQYNMRDTNQRIEALSLLMQLMAGGGGSSYSPYEE